ncbi:MAG TPA: two-component sensor histidine kinase, partial [Treponema sp.]|nr:two-component sensor histidine kinase [Treponema sp.]
GILPDDLGKIFLRFYRSDSSRARNTGGSGLGLSIAQSIVLNHGGSIKADSEYGKWAEFTVKLPER